MSSKRGDSNQKVYLDQKVHGIHFDGSHAVVNLHLCGQPWVICVALSNDIVRDVANVISTKWDVRKGSKVPSTDSIKLAGGAVELDATFLYADLAGSSRLAKELDRRIASKILKSFLAATTRLVRARDGVVISFDGDRVLGVFVGDAKNTSAAKCALNVSWAVSKVIRPRFRSQYQSVKDLGFSISHGVGIDTGTILIVRAGARGKNDLISIGRAPSLAAKLSEIRDASYTTHITTSVYRKLADSSKYGGANKNDNMWAKKAWDYLGENVTLYRSSWWWKP